MELKSQIEWMEEDLRQLKSQLPTKLYRHYKNNRLYTITGECLIQENDKWVYGVLYTLKNGDGQLFCRSSEQFFEKFKLEE